MTRWLEAAQRASEAGTKLTKLTEPSPMGVLSEKSVLSGAASDTDLAFHEARVAALADPDGIARTPEAIDAVWDHAAAMAREGWPRLWAAPLRTGG